MKKNILFLITAFIGLAICFSACQPEKFDLGAVISKDQLKYTITQDATDPNMILLVSETPNATPLWKTPVGNSTRVVDTVKLAFPGQYVFYYGVESSGGYIESDAIKITVTTTNYNYIKDPQWELISGGAGKSKTWYLDLDAAGLSRHFLGPIYFFTKEYQWDNLHNAAGGNYLDSKPWDYKSAITPFYNADGTGAMWYWTADWPGNSWMCDKADFGTMTFDLIGGPNLTVDQKAYGLGSSKGNYSLDTKAHTVEAWQEYSLMLYNRPKHKRA